jgi:hypothetical protein
MSILINYIIPFVISIALIFGLAVALITMHTINKDKKTRELNLKSRNVSDADEVRSFEQYCSDLHMEDLEEKRGKKYDV